MRWFQARSLTWPLSATSCAQSAIACRARRVMGATAAWSKYAHRWVTGNSARSAVQSMPSSWGGGGEAARSRLVLRAQFAHLAVDLLQAVRGAFDVAGLRGLAELLGRLAEVAGVDGEVVLVPHRHLGRLGEIAGGLLQAAGGVFQVGPVVDVEGLGGDGRLVAGPEDGL